MSDLEKEISKLCVSCGYCCDGTLFTKAKAYDEDAPHIARLGLTASENEGNKSFGLPCHHFEGKCTVYDQTRPRTCGKFFCEPVKKIRKQESSVEEVQALIEKVRILREQFFAVVQQQYPEFEDCSLAEIRQRLYNVSEEEQKDFRKKYSSLYVIGARLFPAVKKFMKEK